MVCTTSPQAPPGSGTAKGKIGAEIPALEITSSVALDNGFESCLLLCKMRIMCNIYIMEL